MGVHQRSLLRVMCLLSDCVCCLTFITFSSTRFFFLKIGLTDFSGFNFRCYFLLCLLRHFSPMLSLWLVSVLLDPAIATPLSSNLWVTCVVNQTTLSANTAKKSQTVANVTELVCSAAANIRAWVYMFCFSSVTGCVMYDRLSVDVGNATIGPVLTEPICRIPNSPLGKTRPMD